MKQNVPAGGHPAGTPRVIKNTRYFIRIIFLSELNAVPDAPRASRR